MRTEAAAVEHPLAKNWQGNSLQAALFSSSSETVKAKEGLLKDAYSNTVRKNVLIIFILRKHSFNIVYK